MGHIENIEAVGGKTFKVYLLGGAEAGLPTFYGSCLKVDEQFPTGYAETGKDTAGSGEVPVTIQTDVSPPEFELPVHFDLPSMPYRWQKGDWSWKRLEESPI